MVSPYKSLPDASFRARSVARLNPDDVDPVIVSAFRIAKTDKVATAGSCFAQHIAKRLSREGFIYLVTEEGPTDRGYGVFPARFGNIYSVRQLLQLFDRAYALFEPAVQPWRTANGRYVDPFRPQVEPDGFVDEAEVEADRNTHFAAVRQMFETCDVFVFTLGLTEAWRSTIDGAVYPLAAGVAGGDDHIGTCEFVNFEVEDMTTDMLAFLGKLRAVNPGVRVVLTVSPVPLIATYENRHVMVSTACSKAALRVVADKVTRKAEGVAYFPSYEIITGAHNGNRYFEPDLRNVRPEGVDNVMRLFFRHYATGEAAPVERAAVGSAGVRSVDAELAELNRVICDEEAIAQ